jgi:hypothetical protein
MTLHEIAIGLCIVSAVLNLTMAVVYLLRQVRSERILLALRVNAMSLARQAIEAGAKLPPRCVYCCQQLPAHVEGCPLCDWYADGGWLDHLTKPNIKVIQAEKPPIYIRHP